MNANWIAGPLGSDGRFEILIVTEDDERHVMSPSPTATASPDRDRINCRARTRRHRSCVGSGRSHADRRQHPRQDALDPELIGDPSESGSVIPPCHRRVTHSRNQQDTEGHERTRGRVKLSTGGHERNSRGTEGHDHMPVRDREAPGSNPGPLTRF